MCAPTLKNMNNETKIKIGESVGLAFTGNNEVGEPQFIGKQAQFDEYFAALKLTEEKSL